MSTLALCIPAYNAAQFLPRLLTSATKQSIPFDEILVYDDCSTDDTARVAGQFGATVVKGDVNRGCSFGKNRLAEITSCNWLHFHDADDELLPNFTTLAHKWLNKPDCPDVVLFDYEWRDNDTGELISIRHFEKDKLENDPIAYAIMNQINPFCGLYRKSSYLKVGGYDIDPLILYNEDTAFHIKLAKNGLTFSAEDELSIINYRIHNSMSASNIIKCMVAQYHVLQQTSTTHGTQYARELADQFFNNAAILASVNEWELVKKDINTAHTLGYKTPSGGNRLFLLLTQINGYGAFWLREKFIRLFKPHLRK